MLLLLPSLLALASSLPAGPQEPPPDVFVLRNDREVEGVLLRRNDQQAWLAQGTRIRTLDLADVKEMRGPRVAYPEYLGRLRETFRKKPSAKECNELAAWCLEQGLVRDADLHRWHALSVDPNDEEANEALGHRKLYGRWRIKTDAGGTVDWTELQERHMDFSHPWELTTAHFEVKAASSLEDALNACASLEFLYDAVFETFQDIVGFYEVREPMKIYLYPNRQAYPSIANTLDGYFDEMTRVVYAYFQDGRGIRLLHEATHAILHCTARELTRDEPRLPGWLDEGIASYMDACLTGAPATPRFEPGLRNQTWFDVHALEEKPDSIVRVLNYEKGDFSASSGQALKYAQSYTLVHFLMHGGDEALRQGFERFMISAYDRKGSMSHFRNAMKIRRLDDLEERWLEYVRSK